MSKSNHSLSKSNLSKHRSIQNKHASAKHCGQVTIPHHQVRSGIKSPTDPHIAGSQALCIQNQVDAQTMKSQTPAFQANYVQSSQNVVSEETNNDNKLIIGATVLESPTMQLLTQPPNNQNVSISSPLHTEEIPVVSSVHDNMTTTVASNTSSPKVQSGKACHFIIKKKSDNSMDNQQIAQKIHFTNKPILSKADLGNLKVLQNRPVVVSQSNNTQKILNSSGKLITTKIVQHIPQKSQAQINPNTIPQPINSPQIIDKVLIMPKTPTSTVQSIQRSLCSTPLKNIFISSHSPSKEGDTNNLILKSNDSDILQKGLILSNDVKLPTKTFLLNSKSGHKMVVLPANKRPKAVIGQSVPLLVKGVQGKPATMKLVPVSGQPVTPSKTTNVTVLPKSANANVLGSKILPKDSLPLLKTNPASDSNLPKVISNIQITSKTALQTLKQPTPAKGNVIVVQKGSAMSKNPITLTKGVMNAQKQNLINISLNESHPTGMSTDISMPEAAHEEAISRDVGNLVVLEMNDQMQHGICLTEEYIEEGGDESMTQSSMELKSDQSLIAEENPGLFPNQITEEECNPDSMESTTDSLIETSNVDDVMKSNESSSEEQEIQKIISEKELLSSKEVNLSDFNAWESELGKPEESKNISDKSDDMTLELDMSTDSDGDDYTVTSGDRSKANKQLMQEDGSQDEQGK